MFSFLSKKSVIFIRSASLFSLAVGCAQVQKTSEKPTENETLLLALTAENSTEAAPAACLVQLSISQAEGDNQGKVENVHVVHRTSMSADELKLSENKTIKRILNPTKEGGEESIPEFVDEVRRLVARASEAGSESDCVELAKNLAGQLEERSKAIAEFKAKESDASASNLHCDYDCWDTLEPEPTYYNYPYNYPYQYDKYGPTWAGGSGYPDSYTNSFFNSYYGGYNSGDVLYASSWSSIGRGLERVNSAVGTVDTVGGGCQGNWGKMGGCAAGAVGAWAKDIAGGAALNFGMKIIGAGRFANPLGVALGVMEPTGVADGTLSGYCNQNPSESYCRNYQYHYK